ncbi:MAG: hypothetical protein ACI30C_08335 [Muribaculaceae bacterium]
MGRLAALRLQILVVWALHEQRGGAWVGGFGEMGENDYICG